ncbi:MAG: leucine-rich repeat domain-containing protein, partial [Allobaculum sp.]|nr:leucine-rich repeat domain-containing protein [Allobaculum sp.]
QIEPYAFANCTNLEKISLPSKLKEVSPYVFSGCTHLKQVDLPDGLQSICSYAFENCSSLSHLRIPASVQTIEGDGNQNLAFWGCTQLIICGDSPSVAQSYAQKYGIPFQKDLPENTTIIYRLYKQSTGEHFYTDSLTEQQTCLQNPIWRDEGYGWLAPTSSDLPIYRLYNPHTTDHHYTMDQNEYETLQTIGWNGEGIVFYSALPTDESKPLYRLYNPQAQEAGSHHYTLDATERDALIKLGWKDEGIAWYAIDQTF